MRSDISTSGSPCFSIWHLSFRNQHIFCSCNSSRAFTGRLCFRKGSGRIPFWFEPSDRLREGCKRFVIRRNLRPKNMCVYFWNPTYSQRYCGNRFNRRKLLMFSYESLVQLTFPWWRIAALVNNLNNEIFGKNLKYIFF